MFRMCKLYCKSAKVSHKQLRINFTATVVYCSNARDQRGQLWSGLNSISSSTADNKPWFLFGDFNIVKKENQKKGGNGIARCQDGNVQIAGCAIVWRSCTAELFQVLEEVMLHCIMAHDIG